MTETFRGTSSTPSSDELGVRLVSAAANYFDVKPYAIISRTKHGEVTLARRAVAFVLMTFCGWSSLRVAKLLNKAHPSILNGHKKAQELMKTDEIFFEAVERLKSEVFQ